MPKTPAMEIYLNKDHNNEKAARLVAEKLKEVKLKEIISEISIDFGAKKIKIATDAKGLRAAHISVDKAVEVLGEKGFDVKKLSDGLILDMSKEDFRTIYKTKEKIKEVILTGVKKISQVLVVKRDRDFVILTSGSNLKDVLEFKGVNKDKILTNDLHEIANVLGIEAARQVVINEINKVVVSQGLAIDKKHAMLVADTMTSSGAVKGITRMGIISDKSSILARASFETPVKQFVQATKTGKKDDLNSVIENIILNQPVPVGTGLPGLLVKVTGPLADKAKKAKKEAKK
jgi:DNA-directed RNA polymerase subunit A"